MKLSRWTRWGVLATMVAAGCSSAAETDPVGAVQMELGADPGAAHGPMGAIREALQQLDLRPDQRTAVDQLVTEAKARHAPVLAAREALQKAVADQVQAGRIDRGALAAPIDAVLAAVDRARPGDRAALVRLHDILDKAQREKLVNAIEARFEHRGMKAWRGPGHGPGMAGMKQWAKDLNLTDAQRAQIRGALMSRFAAHKDAMRGRLGEARAEGKKLLEQFEQDTFTLDDSSLQLFSRARIEAGIGRVLDAIEIVLPVLTPEQRTLAAAKIRAIPQPKW